MVLPFRRDVQRLPIFEPGCVGGMLALARAAARVRARPGSRVPLFAVEPCTLTFRYRDRSVKPCGDGPLPRRCRRGCANGPRPGTGGFGVGRIQLDGLARHHGVGRRGRRVAVQFSRSLPDLVRPWMRCVAEEFLPSEGLGLLHIDGFICHPVGAKVLDALESALNLQPGGLQESRTVLRDYGNMSATTVLFVLRRARERRVSKRHLLTSLGPGFSGAFLVPQST